MWKSPAPTWEKPWQKLTQPGKPARTSRGCSIVWLLPNALAFGSLPRTDDALRLHQAGIRSVLTLCAPEEGTLPSDIPEQFTWLRLVLPDSRHPAPPDVAQMERAVRYVHDQISQGHPVYVHCLAGIERSPTVCIAYLCQYHHLELWDAIHQVKQVRPQTLLSDLQMQTLRPLIL